MNMGTKGRLGGAAVWILQGRHWRQMDPTLRGLVCILRGGCHPAKGCSPALPTPRRVLYAKVGHVSGIWGRGER